MISVVSATTSKTNRLFIAVNGDLICRVFPSFAEDGEIDMEATRKRAEHIAEALRQYKESQ